MRAAMTAEEQRSLLDMADSLPDLFRAVAAARGAAPALRDGARTLSYRELDDLTDRIAARLAAEGVRPGDRVGILLPRSAETQISILAVLKAGAAYVPLDPSYPAERLRFLVRDAEIRVLVGDAGHVAARGLTDLRVLAPEADDTTPPARPSPSTAANWRTSSTLPARPARPRGAWSVTPVCSNWSAA